MIRRLILAALLVGCTTFVGARAWIAQVPAAAAATCCTFVSPAAVGSDTTGSTFTSISTSSTINVASGNLVVVGCRQGTDTTAPSSVSDSGSNSSSTVITSSTLDGGLLTIFAIKNTVANATATFKCTWAGAHSFIAVEALQYSGASTTAPSDVFANGTVFGADPVVSGTFTTTAANEVSVACAVTSASIGNTFSAGTGYTKRLTDAGGMMACEDQFFTSTQTGITASMNAGPVDKQIVVATFK